jgi:hypothetical protein
MQQSSSQQASDVVCQDLQISSLTADPNARRIRQNKVDGIANSLQEGKDFSRSYPIDVLQKNDGVLMILNGHHRWKAAIKARKESWPCNIYKNIPPHKIAAIKLNSTEHTESTSSELLQLLYTGIRDHYLAKNQTIPADKVIKKLTIDGNESPLFVAYVIPAKSSKSSDKRETSNWMGRWVWQAFFGYRPLASLTPLGKNFWFSSVKDLSEIALLTLFPSELDLNEHGKHRLTCGVHALLDLQDIGVLLGAPNKTLSVQELEHISRVLCKIRRVNRIKKVINVLHHLLQNTDNYDLVKVQWECVCCMISVAELLQNKLKNPIYVGEEWQRIGFLLTYSPLDFYSIFFGPLYSPIVSVVPTDTLNDVWKKLAYDYNAVGLVQQTLQMIALRGKITEKLLKGIKDVVTQHELVDNILTYVKALQEADIPESPEGLSDFEYFLYSANDPEVEPEEVVYDEYKDQVGLLSLDEDTKLGLTEDGSYHGVGFIKSYSNLNWFNFVNMTKVKANLVVLDPPFLQTYSSSNATEKTVNTIKALNSGLDPNLARLTEDNLCERLMESALEALEANGILFLWCSLEQGALYMKLFKQKKFPTLKGCTFCSINGKVSRQSQGANQQIPTNQSEYFIVGYKGTPNQTSFQKWGVVYEEGEEPKSQSNHFKCPQKYWKKLPKGNNAYPFMKPQELMRDLMFHYCTPGQLVFEGFSGTKSCVLGAVANMVNLVCVDNNPITHQYFKKSYQTMKKAEADLKQFFADPNTENLWLPLNDGTSLYEFGFYGPQDWLLMTKEQLAALKGIPTPGPSRKLTQQQTDEIESQKRPSSSVRAIQKRPRVERADDELSQEYPPLVREEVLLNSPDVLDNSLSLPALGDSASGDAPVDASGSGDASVPGSASGDAPGDDAPDDASASDDASGDASGDANKDIISEDESNNPFKDPVRKAVHTLFDEVLEADENNSLNASDDD